MINLVLTHTPTHVEAHYGATTSRVFRGPDAQRDAGLWLDLVVAMHSPDIYRAYAACEALEALGARDPVPVRSYIAVDASAA